MADPNTTPSPPERASRVAYMSMDSLLRRSGAEWLEHVESLTLRGSEDAGRIERLDNLGALTSLRSLDMSGNALTSLAPLSGLNVPTGHGTACTMSGQ